MLIKMPAAHLHRKQPWSGLNKHRCKALGVQPKCVSYGMKRRLLCDVHAALIKVCMAYERGTIPGNLHFNEPNPNNSSLTSGVLKVHQHSAWRSQAGFASRDACN